MGKGDKKNRRGKIINGSYGVRRPRKADKIQGVQKQRPSKKSKPKKLITKAD